MKNKKGLNKGIETILIILLILAAVTIVWSFIKPVLDQTNEEDLDSMKNLCEKHNLMHYKDSYERSYCYKIKNDIIVDKYLVRKIGESYYLEEVIQ